MDPKSKLIINRVKLLDMKNKPQYTLSSTGATVYVVIYKLILTQVLFFLII